MTKDNNNATFHCCQRRRQQQRHVVGVMTMLGVSSAVAMMIMMIIPSTAAFQISLPSLATTFYHQKKQQKDTHMMRLSVRSNSYNNEDGHEDDDSHKFSPNDQQQQQQQPLANDNHHHHQHLLAVTNAKGLFWKRRQATIFSASSLLLFSLPFLLGYDDNGNSNNILHPSAAWASGGATAGKYTTIPIAKRRYYGRVEQGVHDFLDLAPYVIQGDSSVQGTTTSVSTRAASSTTASSSTAALPSPNKIYTFFDTTNVVVVKARNQAVNGQCTKADATCRGKEVRDSRYHDMKTSMYLLANAFRINQQKAPDMLPTVQAAKQFFREVDAMDSNVQKLLQLTTNKESNNNNMQLRDTFMAAQQHYIRALDFLDVYLDLVELPPTDSGYYDTDFDTRVGETARIM